MIWKFMQKLKVMHWWLKAELAQAEYDYLIEKSNNRSGMKYEKTPVKK